MFRNARDFGFVVAAPTMIATVTAMSSSEPQIAAVHRKTSSGLTTPPPGAGRRAP
jgi:hypothetical protein